MSKVFELPEQLPTEDVTNPAEGRDFLVAYLNNCSAWFLATLDEKGNPFNRPMSLVTVHDDQVVFATMKSKDVCTQLEANPAFSISAYLPKHGWLKVDGKVEVAKDQAGLDEKFMAENPSHYKHYLGKSADENIYYALVDTKVDYHHAHKVIDIKL